MTLPTAWPRAAGLAAGFVADLLLGDPARRHPVAGFGALAAALERRDYADSRAVGCGHVAVLVGGAVLAGSAVESLTRKAPLARFLCTAAATWAVLGATSLQREAAAVAGYLETGDLAQARLRIRSLVGRETDALSESELARATVESVAENTSDAVVAPLLWGAAAGLPGLLGYRAVNTLDAMIGHRSPRYLRYGWAAARLDDAANWIPARLSALLAAVSAPLVGGQVRTAVQTVRRDADRHPSPNAGQVEAAFAGALGVQLGGANRYHGEVEDRGTLGDGPVPRTPDIARARRLALVTGLGGLAAAVGLCVAVGLRGATSRR